MYIFEFKHTLTRDDLSHIWQNLPPKIGTSMEIQEVSISHRLLSDSLMGESIDVYGVRFRDKIRWMVFKVKRKGKTKYFEQISAVTSQRMLPKGNTSQTLGEIEIDEITPIYERIGSEDIPAYSYNWPYDYFSLVEFASLDAEVVVERSGIEDILRGRLINLPQTTTQQKAALEAAIGSEVDAAYTRAARDADEDFLPEIGDAAQDKIDDFYTTEDAYTLDTGVGTPDAAVEELLYKARLAAEEGDREHES
jgi:hypothetical protein